MDTHLKNFLIEQWIDKVASLASLDRNFVFNPWRDYDPELDVSSDAPQIRRANLLSYMQARGATAKVLIVGEAPGYNGCRFSGLAMTSERQLLAEGDLVDSQFFNGLKRRTSNLKLSTFGMTEPTASIVWPAMLEALRDPFAFVNWNIFPFHPHQLGDSLSNRTPNSNEVEMCSDLFLQFRACFPEATIIAMGSISANHIETITGIKPYAVRHPANGGATLFRDGVKLFAENNLKQSLGNHE